MIRIEENQLVKQKRGERKVLFCQSLFLRLICLYKLAAAAGSAG